MDSDDEIPQLSEATLAALQEFYDEQSKSVMGDPATEDENCGEKKYTFSQSDLLKNDLSKAFPEDWVSLVGLSNKCLSDSPCFGRSSLFLMK